MPGEQSLKALQQRCSNLERDLDNALKMLREKDEVLAWVSRNVWVIRRGGNEWNVGSREPHPTLYEALLAAYKKSGYPA